MEEDGLYPNILQVCLSIWAWQGDLTKSGAENQGKKMWGRAFFMNAVLTDAVGFSSKHSLIEKFAVTGPVSGMAPERRNQGLDEVRTAFSAAQPPRTRKSPARPVHF
jgi:hypothetical protein